MFQLLRTNRPVRAWLALPLLILLLAGCTKSKEPEKPPFEGRITLWTSLELAGHPARLEEGWLEERSRAFSDQRKGITVEIRHFPTGEELERALLESSERPDLALGRALPLPADRLAALPLKPELVSDHPEAALIPYRRGQALAGLPLLLDLQVLALNEPLFAARGIPLPGESWGDPEVADILSKITGNEVFAIGFSVAPGYHQWWPLTGSLFDWHGVAPGGQAGLDRLAGWRRAYLHPDLATLTAEESYRLFAEGKIAMLPVSTWAIPLLREEPFRASFRVAPFPGRQNLGYAYGIVALEGAQSEEKRAAMADLVSFLAAADQQVRLARKTGLMPARTSAPNPFEGDGAMSRAFQLRGDFKPLPAGPAWDAAQPAIAHELLLALYGGKRPQEVLAAVKTHLNVATTPAK
ncbi:MAG: extracellular solute-binding protein [Bacillota bacterium]